MNTTRAPATARARTVSVPIPELPAPARLFIADCKRVRQGAHSSSLCTGATRLYSSRQSAWSVVPTAVLTGRQSQPSLKEQSSTASQLPICISRLYVQGTPMARSVRTSAYGLPLRCSGKLSSCTLAATASADTERSELASCLKAAPPVTSAVLPVRSAPRSASIAVVYQFNLSVIVWCCGCGACW